MIEERHVFSLRFREVAERYAAEAADGCRDWRRSSKANATAGELLIASYHRGYLSLPGLAALVDWVENPPPRPEGVQAWLVPNPANLFGEVCGFNRVVCRVVEGKLETVGDAVGGLIPDALENSPALHQPRSADSVSVQEATWLRHCAMVCRLLAEEIEKSNPKEARGLWIYEQAMRGQTWPWIAANVPGWCLDVEQIGTPEGVKLAADRYAKKHNLPAIPKRKPGKPRKPN